MLRAIVIDTSPIIRRVATVILRDFGIEVRGAGSGGEGLAMVMRTEPTIVLVDASLPDMSTLDVLRYVRDNLPKTTHAIYCPLEFDLPELQRAQAAGATDILVKPFDRASFAAKIEGWRAGAEQNVRPTAMLRMARADFMRV